MKMTKQDLKMIVKECLVEILSEGLVSTQKTINESRQASPRQVQEQRAVPAARPNIADKISFLPNKADIGRTSQRGFPDQGQGLAKSLTSDPVLAEIFADTARTGAHRNMNESSSGANHEQMIATAGDVAAKTMLRSDPSDIFGDSASKWAALAFSEKIPSRS
jgi:hypothetical protein